MGRRYDPRNPPAWPLGCATAGCGLILIFNLLGLGGIMFAASGLPAWAQQGGTFLLALAVPGLMLVGGLATRRRNPYGARVLVWGCGLTLVIGAAITLVLNLIDRLSGV